MSKIIAIICTPSMGRFEIPFESEEQALKVIMQYSAFTDIDGDTLVIPIEVQQQSIWLLQK
jgi:hypothetical protein